MPRISAATIAENREHRQSALLEAAAELARTAGPDAVTVAAIAKQAGIARSSFYSYFDSAADAIADVLADELADMNAALARAVEGLADTHSIVAAWIEVSLDYVATGRHAFVRAAAKVDMPPVRRAQLGNMHKAMLSPLVEALRRSGAAEPIRSAQFIAAAVDVCVRRIEAGAAPQPEISAVMDFITQGLSCARPSSLD